MRPRRRRRWGCRARVSTGMDSHFWELRVDERERGSEASWENPTRETEISSKKRGGAVAPGLFKARGAPGARPRVRGKKGEKKSHVRNFFRKWVRFEVFFKS